MLFILESVLIDMWHQMGQRFVSDFNYSAEGIMIRDSRGIVIAVSRSYIDVTDDVVELIGGVSLSVSMCREFDVWFLQFNHVQSRCVGGDVAVASIEVSSHDYISVFMLGVCMFHKDGEGILG